MGECPVALEALGVQLLVLRGGDGDHPHGEVVVARVRRLLDQPGHDAEQQPRLPGEDDGLVDDLRRVEADVGQDAVLSDGLVVGQAPVLHLLVDPEDLDAGHLMEVVRVCAELDGARVGVHVFSFAITNRTVLL